MKDIQTFLLRHNIKFHFSEDGSAIHLATKDGEVLSPDFAEERKAWSWLDQHFEEIKDRYEK